MPFAITFLIVGNIVLGASFQSVHYEHEVRTTKKHAYVIIIEWYKLKLEQTK